MRYTAPVRETLHRWLFARHLDEDETVSAVLHGHWMLGLRTVFWPGVSALLSLTAFTAGALRETSPALLLIIAAWATASVVWFIRGFFDYYLDAWIVTDKGIIDLEWHGWFHRESSRILYSDINGVSYEIKGVWGTMLRFGTVSVEKISTGSSISLEYVSRPQSVEGLILKNMEAYLHSKNMKDSRHVQDILAGLVSQNVQMEQFSSAKKDPKDSAKENTKKSFFRPRRLE